MSQEISVPTMWSLKQAATETGLSEFTLKQAIKQEHIKFIRLGEGKFLSTLPVSANTWKAVGRHEQTHF